MKITMYTITECQFSKKEREYLSSHGLQFEEKNLETNREFLTEMLAVGSNFAGTPVTKIEKDDGQIVVLKGFTVSEFDKTLGFAQTPGVENTKPAEAAQVQEQAPAVEVAPVDVAPATATPTPVQQPEAPQAAPAPATTDPAMASVLDTLVQQAQVASPAATPAAPVSPQPPVAGQPVIPDPQF